MLTEETKDRAEFYAKLATNWRQPAIVISEKCPYCSKFRSPLEIIPMSGGAKICVHCEQRHLEALNLLATHTFTGECSECGKHAERGSGVMAIHYEGGKYRVMCLPCDAIYVMKRRDLYGGTEFAQSIGL